MLRNEIGTRPNGGESVQLVVTLVHQWFTDGLLTPGLQSRMDLDPNLNEIVKKMRIRIRP